MNIVGVVVMFFWGAPQPVLEEGVSVGLQEGSVLATGQTVGEYNERVRARRLRHFWLSRVGLGLVLVGFVLEFWGLWVPVERQAGVVGLAPADTNRVGLVWAVAAVVVGLSVVALLFERGVGERGS